MRPATVRRYLLGTPSRQFATVSLVVIGLITVVLCLVISYVFRRDLLEREWRTTADFVRTEAAQNLTPADFSQPWSDVAQGKFRRFYEQTTMMPEIVRVKIYDSAMTVIWSDEPRLLRQRFPDNAQLRQALAGRTVVNLERGDEKKENVFERAEPFLVEMYVPIVFPGSATVVGVAETYKEPTEVFKNIARGQITVVSTAIAGAIVLHLCLFWIVRRAAVRIERQHQVLEQQTTELRNSAEQVRQLQKLEAVGRLAGGVAHDFNNLLTVISGRAQLLLRKLPPGSREWETVELIRATGERAASLTKQLLAFSRKQVLEPRVVDLNAAVGDMSAMLRRLIGEDVDLMFRPGPNLGHVKVDPSQLEQVVMNLVVNARDAMPSGGHLTIETGNVELDEHYALAHIGVSPGPYVMLAISDTGIGMDAGTQAHIFEPFFTTKEPGRGTGLGLATVYGIVKQSGGDIWVYSEPGRGTTFKTYWPRVSDPAQPITETAPLPRGGSETILLVEDDDDVRAFAREILVDHGYAVLEARGPGEALLRAERHSEPIDVLVTDVVMPQMNGRELAERLASVRPEMQTLYMSGYTDDAIVRGGVLDPGTRFIEKPFTVDGLAAKVREVLDAASLVSSASR